MASLSPDFAAWVQHTEIALSGFIEIGLPLILGVTTALATVITAGVAILAYRRLIRREEPNFDLSVHWANVEGSYLNATLIIRNPMPNKLRLVDIRITRPWIWFLAHPDIRLAPHARKGPVVFVGQTKIDINVEVPPTGDANFAFHLYWPAGDYSERQPTTIRLVMLAESLGVDNWRRKISVVRKISGPPALTVNG